ncbi:MAG TPA: hypothetical protein VGL72_17170 [Bryobacteraceae bacterium]|jgi:hypothetical protein
MNPTRRAALAALGAAGACLTLRSQTPEVDRAIVERNDAMVEQTLKVQITDSASHWCGSIPDDYNLHSAGAAGALIDGLTASLVCSQSKFHSDRELARRIALAAAFIGRSQSPEGFVDLLSTNFNSPPDTGFLVHSVAAAAAVAHRYGNSEVVKLLHPVLKKAADGLSVGGIHTPNHRWVVSSALAQVNSVFPDPAYTRRIDQWLAEGIDIDADGQYTERSTVTYNTVVDRAFVVMAAKLGRPELLAPVRTNLRAMLYLIHPDGEVVTEVSRRQDQFVRGSMAGYWFPARYLAIHDRDPQIAALSRQIKLERVPLSTLLEYPELNGALPDPGTLPDDYEKFLPLVGLARIRRGPRDATIVLTGNSRFLSLRGNGPVVQAVRFASAFFGKGQFTPQSGGKEGEGYRMHQALEAPYYQPLDPPQQVTPANWSSLRASRRTSQVCRLEQTALVRETRNGIELQIESKGTPGVPLAVEISLREGGKLEGCRPAPHQPDGWILEKDFATYRVNDGALRFGPGAAPHLLTQLRGAEPKLPGASVYLTGYTPFAHTLRFEWI